MQLIIKDSESIYKPKYRENSSMSAKVSILTDNSLEFIKYINMDI